MKTFSNLADVKHVFTFNPFTLQLLEQANLFESSHEVTILSNSISYQDQPQVPTVYILLIIENEFSDIHNGNVQNFQEPKKSYRNNFFFM